jgi:hypothetical protein
MARIVIKCFPAPGFDGVFRAGRKWPMTGTEVETTAGAADIPAADGGVLQIGTDTMKALEADGRFSFGIAGSVQELDALNARVVELEAENAALKAQLAQGTADATKDQATKPAKGK